MYSIPVEKIFRKFMKFQFFADYYWNVLTLKVKFKIVINKFQCLQKKICADGDQMPVNI